MRSQDNMCMVHVGHKMKGLRKPRPGRVWENGTLPTHAAMRWKRGAFHCYAMPLVDSMAAEEHFCFIDRKLHEGWTC